MGHSDSTTAVDPVGRGLRTQAVTGDKRYL